MIYTGKKQRATEKETKENKLGQLQKSQAKQVEQLTLIYDVFQKNLHQFAGKYRDEISKNPDFREKFNELCDKMDVNPMMSKKTIWSDLGFGDFYNELAIKILDICAKKYAIYGGITKITDIIDEFRKVYGMKVSKSDIERAINTVSSLGGCHIHNKYVYTVPIEMSPDFNLLLEVAEEERFVNEKIMQVKKGWTKERFYQKIQVLQREGLVWADKKTQTKIVDYYFPSLLNTYFDPMRSQMIMQQLKQ
ncbi:unnamed protein product (macronuclear) [Paramecium tetraurelia]|uniref:Uncharacterized protein n=1 Tax=Paramecium tetraurelia TaxID=5888 RepID=A0CXW2_PARTE|nr:uncharacterized protein GSPATT00011261001 [Paramecium tetraurelia]CAK75629.1 unnamed protein product [Paramecium tetraurelia]|eukprot:XP_001443026.1 hypothetical protein (macronuclear) [Paramecium tetraurelia strain d4-2]